MRSKKGFITLCLSIAIVSSCNNADKTKEEQNNAALPAELKDTSVLQADEENALEKLNQVMDTSKKE